MDTLLGKHWHHLQKNEVLDLLDTNLQQGLDIFEVKHRQERFGLNVLTPKKGKSPLQRFLLQFNNPLVYILLVASLVTAVLKDPVDALVIFGVVLINAIIGYLQESRAEQAIAALAQTMTTEAAVVRGGKVLRLAAAELVPPLQGLAGHREQPGPPGGRAGILHEGRGALPGKPVVRRLPGQAGAHPQVHGAVQDDPRQHGGGLRGGAPRGGGHAL